jgi:hypothetical protein
VPTIDLVVGSDKSNTSPILKLFLSRRDDLIARVSKNSTSCRTDAGWPGLAAPRRDLLSHT